jgi:hypothetical protein
MFVISAVLGSSGRLCGGLIPRPGIHNTCYKIFVVPLIGKTKNIMTNKKMVTMKVKMTVVMMIIFMIRHVNTCIAISCCMV